jgi:VRR-NUC domain
MNEQALVPILGPSEARRLTDEIKRDAEALWQKLVELYDGGAHTALGYSSWQAYCETEFGFGRSQSYRLLDAGRIAASIPQLGNEAQARELAPLLRDEGENGVAEVWSELRAEHGEQLTAEKVRTAVEKKLAPKPACRVPKKPHTAPSGESLSFLDSPPVTHVTEKQFMAAVVEMAQMLGWLVYHTFDSRRSEAGFPDIVCVRRDRVLFIELKTEKGRLSEEQERWLSALGLAGAEVHCWRPSDWPAIEAAVR